MTIIETLCATASCSSREILARSSTTASRAATSRSRSASRARLSRSPTIRRRTTITTTVPSANPTAVLFQFPGLASRPSRQQVGEPDEGHAGHERPARGPDGQAVQGTEPGDRPAAGLQIVPGVKVERADALRGDARGGRVALAERDGGADGGGEQRAQHLLTDRPGSEREFEQRGRGQDGGNHPVALSFIPEPQVHAAKVIPPGLLVIGQSDEAAGAKDRPIARSEDRPPRR